MNRLQRTLGTCVLVLASAACGGGGDGGGSGGLRGEGPLRGDLVLRVTAEGAQVYFEDSFGRFFTGSDPELSAYEWSRWVEPGECATEGTTIQMDRIPVGETVRLLAPGFTATAVQVSAGTSNVQYSWSGGGDAGTPLGTTFDVELAGTDTLDPIFWKDGLELLELPEIEAPPAFASGNVVFDASSELAVEWEPMQADFVIIQFTDGTAGEFDVFCGSEDTGVFTVPANVIQSLPAAGNMFVRGFRNEYREFLDGEVLLQGRTSVVAYFTKT